MLRYVLVLLCLGTLPVLPKIVRNETFICRQNEKRCPNGACSTLDDACDGADYLSTSRQVQQSRSRRQAAQSRLQNQGACVLPPYPEHGTYTVSNVPTATPGQSFDSFVLTVSCRRGFAFLGSDDGVDGPVTQVLYCVLGQTQTMPKCVRFCKLDPHPSVRYACLYGTGFRKCRKYVPPGTLVSPTCNGPIYTSAESMPYMTCRSGYWDYVARCKAECGRVTSVGEQLVLGGEVARRGELPWHVGIYIKSATTYLQICGGSLVSNNRVISAAHCFWSDVKGKLPPSNFAVAAGKLYRDWDSTADNDAQKSDVKEIKIPILFAGMSANLQEDIAAVFLTTPFVYKTHVRPVCLNYDSNFDSRQLQEGKTGKVAGWGLTTANGGESPVLRVVDMPYINLQNCLPSLPASFREYITGDKFCAGYTNGTALCRGDSGGGLAFAAYTELDIERYYLRGVVSAAPTTEDACNAHTYTAFTKIIKHEQFIKESLARADKWCPSFLFQCDDGECVDQGADCNGKQDCADGSDEAEELCALGPAPTAQAETTETYVSVTSKEPCVLPPYPNHGSYKVINESEARPGQILSSYSLQVTCEEGYYMLNPNKATSGRSYQDLSCPSRSPFGPQRMPQCLQCGLVTVGNGSMDTGDGPAKPGELPWHANIYAKSPSYKIICGGSLITNDVVLTVAHCFAKKVPPAPSEFAVAAGKLNALWGHADDVDSQTSDVSSIILSSDFKPASASSLGDIAVVKLLTAFVFTARVSPVCLDLGEIYNRPSLFIGDPIKVAAWSTATTDGIKRRLDRLKVVDMTYIDLNTCNKSLPLALAQYTFHDKICAGYGKDRSGFRSLAGSGLVLYEKEVDQSIKRYFLKGLTSHVAPCYKTCVNTADSYFMFTDIRFHLNFLRRSI